MEIKVVTVLGANGSMGRNISAIFASFGNAKVYMVSRKIDDAKQAKIKAIQSVKSHIIEKNLIAETYDNLEKCISESDLIFESLTESFEIKQDMYVKIKKYLKNDAIIATGTSGLSIEKLSKSFSEQQQKSFFGIHMFNPPYNLTLCELIPTENVDKNLLEKLTLYLSQTLYRDVIVVKDSPAFIGNRVGFQFINESMQYAEKYAEYGGIDFIDYLIGEFTGRNMPPLKTADFVGLDTHIAIVDNIKDNIDDYASDTFIVPDYIRDLVLSGKLGKKSNEGLYKNIKHEDGNVDKLVYDILSGSYRVINNYNFDFVNKMIECIKNAEYKEAFRILSKDESIESKITRELLIKYVIYSLYVSSKIGESVDSVDKAMSSGFNWIQPTSLVEVFGGVDSFKNIAKENLGTIFLDNVDFEKIELSGFIENKKFKKFLRAK